MNAPSTHRTGQHAANRRGIVRRARQVGGMFLLQAAILFVGSGQVDWPMAWAYVVIYVAMLAVNASLLLRRSPDLIAERAVIRAGTKGWDRWLGALYLLLGMIGILLVAALDRRYGWSMATPLAVQLAGLAAVALGNALVSWAMITNRFFAISVRIQKDRGQTVITDGPYRFVRHPGYAGAVVQALGTALMLGSWWALAPAGLAVGVIVLRTALEDRTLQAELVGYLAYTSRTRYRLLPRIW